MQKNGNLNVELRVKNQEISSLKDYLDRLKFVGVDVQKPINILE